MILDPLWPMLRAVTRLMLLCLIAAALALPTALARTPLPPRPQGAGKEPTARGGIVGGKRFRARSALAQYDASGDIYLYLFQKRVRCRLVTYADAPYIWVWVHTEGTPPVVGKPSLSNGRDFVQVNFVLKGHYVAIQPGVRLVFTRVDPRRNGVWHGRLAVKRTRLKGRVYAYAGTFAARWCGRL